MRSNFFPKIALNKPKTNDEVLKLFPDLFRHLDELSFKIERELDAIQTKNGSSQTAVVNVGSTSGKLSVGGLSAKSGQELVYKTGTGISFGDDSFDAPPNVILFRCYNSEYNNIECSITKITVSGFLATPVFDGTLEYIAFTS